jgi:hypothetical protein
VSQNQANYSLPLEQLSVKVRLVRHSLTTTTNLDIIWPKKNNHTPEKTAFNSKLEKKTPAKTHKLLNRN